SFLGIMLGVATLIVVMAVMNGFRKDLLDKILGLNGHLSIQSPRRPLTDWDALAQRLALVPGIKLAAPIVDGQALAAFTAGGEGVGVRGIRGQALRKLTAIADNISQGSLDEWDRSGGIVIGKRLAKKLAATPGDNVTLMALRGDCTPIGCLPRMKSYRIAA